MNESILIRKDDTHWSNLIMTEKRIWHIKMGGVNGDGFIPELGRCEFCGHHSKSGWMIEAETGQLLSVGTDCVGSLCNLSKAQMSVLKYSDKRYAIRRRYSKVLSFLREQHKTEIIKANIFIKEDDKYVIFKDMYGVEIQTMKENWKRWNMDDSYFCKAPKWSASWIAFNIIQKIEKTTGVNKFWFEKYKELTQINLTEVI